MPSLKTLAVLLGAVAMIIPATSVAAAATYADLLALYEHWRAIERPALRDGAPDYTVAAVAQRASALEECQARLAAIDPAAWPREQRIDYELVRAQMRGMEFELRWLQPWARDPAYYQSIWTEQSDTPEHEGPAHHAIIETWQYRFPLGGDDDRKLAAQLRTVAPLLEQARSNLTGNARDLWITGTATMRQQLDNLDELTRKTPGGSRELSQALASARTATQAFVGWLEAQAPNKTGPSGIGKEAYDWSLRHVHLVPLTWDDEVMLLKRELARAHASLREEESRNRGLPPLTAPANAEEYARKADAAVGKYMAWLKSRDIFDVAPYLEPALRAHIDPFVPQEKRNFFSIASHYEPITLYAHFQHWFDHAWLVHAPHASPIRRTAWGYNVWDSRAEGMATAMEELILHAGYYDDNPRAREIVWIMLAQRAARGLASLYAHANLMDIREAKAFQVEWTPRGWMRPDLDLLHFEQQLYLRQPGYGTSYVTGKHLIDELIRDRSHQLGADFTL
ncbi:MAG TPA: DUF885 family protein, partial [Steroidobacteraceae bacterium]|nr:DUF885 family protein [Steroidobacteraceae bacterium]